MCGRSSMNLSSLKRRAEMLGRSMSPTSSSKIMHHVLRSRVRHQRKFIGRISYSSAQSTLSSISLVLWHIRESRSATRVCVSDRSVNNRAARTSYAASAVTQLTGRGALSIVSSWVESSIAGQTSPLNTFSQSLALDNPLLGYCYCVSNEEESDCA